MQRSSETIGAIAAALAKAQAEITNPEKSLNTTIQSWRAPDVIRHYGTSPSRIGFSLSGQKTSSALHPRARYRTDSCVTAIENQYPIN